LLLLCCRVTSEFDRPWDDSRNALVIDPYEQNSIDWDAVSKDDRVVGIIHRATSGMEVDRRYEGRKKIAVQRGYKWGSYHLLKLGDPERQADFYLSVVKPSQSEVIALDVEAVGAADTPTVENVLKFVTRVQFLTGQYPMLYGNQDVVRKLSSCVECRNILGRCPLWYARFRGRVSDFPRTTWRTYTLWQFKSELNCRPTPSDDCPYTVLGTDFDMDVSVYYGTATQLRTAWPFR
jgi:GH25 family lysozyme M1 (1,4-beta-N-acetylmuramidase)